MQRTVRKVRKSSVVVDRERNVGKSASPSKHLSLLDENINSTQVAEIKETLDSKIKVSIGEKFNQLKGENFRR